MTYLVCFFFDGSSGMLFNAAQKSGFWIAGASRSQDGIDSGRASEHRGGQTA